MPKRVFQFCYITIFHFPLFLHFNDRHFRSFEVLVRVKEINYSYIFVFNLTIVIQTILKHFVAARLSISEKQFKHMTPWRNSSRSQSNFD